MCRVYVFSKDRCYVVINRLSCFRGQIPGLWVFLKLELGPAYEVNNFSVDAVWPVVPEYTYVVCVLI